MTVLHWLDILPIFRISSSYAEKKKLLVCFVQTASKCERLLDIARTRSVLSSYRCVKLSLLHFYLSLVTIPSAIKPTVARRSLKVPCTLSFLE